MRLLNELTAIQAGHPFRGKIPEVKGTGVLAVQMKDLSLQEGICWSRCIETEPEGKRCPDFLVEKDILLVARGSHNYAVLVNNEFRLTGFQAVASPHLYILRVRTSELMPEYLVWWLNQEPSQRYFEQNSEGSFTKSIRRSVLAKTPVTLPPLSQQLEIVHLAQMIDQEKYLFKRLLSNGERLMNGISQKLFNDVEK